MNFGNNETPDDLGIQTSLSLDEVIHLCAINIGLTDVDSHISTYMASKETIINRGVNLNYSKPDIRRLNSIHAIGEYDY